jgi:hypothetical protein
LVSILSLHLKLLWSFHTLFSYENVQLGALDIKAGTCEAKFAVKCHLCGICLSAQVEIPAFTRTTGPHPVCQLIDTGGCLPGIKQSAHEYVDLYLHSHICLTGMVLTYRHEQLWLYLLDDETVP